MTSSERETTFRRWFGEHQGLLWRVVRSFSNRAEDQADLLQEILLQTWRSLPSFRGESKETTWLYRVAFNTAMAWQRKEKRRRMHHEAFSSFIEQQTLSRDLELSAGEGLVEHLYQAIRQLPKADASLALMHLDGLSYREMAEVLGLSDNHIGVRLHRIRKQLTEQLKGPRL